MQETNSGSGAQFHYLHRPQTEAYYVVWLNYLSAQVSNRTRSTSFVVILSPKDKIFPIKSHKYFSSGFIPGRMLLIVYTPSVGKVARSSLA
jgi:hypothetical protein